MALCEPCAEWEERTGSGSFASAPPPAAQVPHASHYTTALIGAVSGLMSRVVTHPMDTLKTRLQTQGTLATNTFKYTSTLQAVTSSLRTPATLYRGFGAVAMTSPFASAVYLVSYEALRAQLDNSAVGSAGASVIVSGVGAQFAAGILYTPMEVVKERLQVSAGGAGATTMAVVRDVVHKGGVGALWKGFWIGNAAWMPWNAVYWTCYEAGRGACAASPLASRDGTILPAASACCAAASAAVATAATHPLDVLKTRLQTGAASASVRSVAAHAYATGALSAGLSARVLSIAPGAGITFLVFEALRSAMG